MTQRPDEVDSLVGERLTFTDALPFGHEASLSFLSPRGPVVSGRLDKAAELTWYTVWDLGEGVGRSIETPQRGRPGPVWALPDGGVLSATGRQAVSAPCVARWEPGFAALREVIEGKLVYYDPVSGIGHLIAPDAAIETWDFGAGDCLSRYLSAPLVRAIEADQRPPTVCGTKGTLLAASPTLTEVVVVELGEEAPRCEIALPFIVARVVLAPILPLLAVVGFEGELEVYNARSGERCASLPSREAGIAARTLCFHPSRPALYVPLDDGALELWDKVDTNAPVLGGRWGADPDPNSGPIDVLVVDVTDHRDRVSCSHMNHRLKVGQLEDNHWSGLWQGSYPISACAVEGDLIAVGDQDGAVTFIRAGA